MGAGARPAFASEVTFGMLMDNMGALQEPLSEGEVRSCTSRRSTRQR